MKKWMFEKQVASINVDMLNCFPTEEFFKKNTRKWTNLHIKKIVQHAAVSFHVTTTMCEQKAFAKTWNRSIQLAAVKHPSGWQARALLS